MTNIDAVAEQVQLELDRDFSETSRAHLYVRKEWIRREDNTWIVPLWWDDLETTSLIEAVNVLADVEVELSESGLKVMLSPANAPESTDSN